MSFTLQQIRTTTHHPLALLKKGTRTSRKLAFLTLTYLSAAPARERRARALTIYHTRP